MASDYIIPLPGEAEHFAMTAPWPITSDQWTYLMDVLCAMRPGLVHDPEPVESPAWLAWQEVNCDYAAPNRTPTPLKGGVDSLPRRPLCQRVGEGVYGHLLESTSGSTQ